MISHHAYLLVGSFEWANTLLKKKNLVGGPDCVVETYANFGIDDARAIMNLASRAPVKEKKRSFILMCTALTVQAQNALLKLFEDPSDTAQFYLVVPRADMLIPTVRSRLHDLGREQVTCSEVSLHEARDFMHGSYADRLSRAGTYATGDDETLTSFLHALEMILFESRDNGGLQEMVFLLTYIKGPGASKKMLLEHLALSLSCTTQMR